MSNIQLSHVNLDAGNCHTREWVSAPAALTCVNLCQPVSTCADLCGPVRTCADLCGECAGCADRGGVREPYSSASVKVAGNDHLNLASV